MSVTQSAVLGPVVISGTGLVKLEQAAWSPSGQLAAAGASGVLFERDGALTVTTGYTQSAWTLALDYSANGQQLATGSVDGSARLFETAGGTEVLEMAAPNPRVARVRFRPGAGGLLATLGGDNQVALWDVEQQAFLGRLDPGPSAAGALALSGDGRWLAAAGPQAVEVWDAAGLLKGLGPPSLSLALGANVSSVALSADGRRAAAGGQAGAIEIWELPGGRPVGSLRGVGAPAVQLAFSPDGRVLASAHLDGTIRLWSTAEGGAARPLATLAGHTGMITSLAFSAEGEALASSSWDGTVRVWAVGTE